MATQIGIPLKDLRGFLSEDEVHNLIDSTMHTRDKLLLRFLWVTGARISEVVGDKSWYKPVAGNPREFPGVLAKDVDFKERCVYLSLLKRRQYPPPKHRVPLDKITLQNLATYIKDNEIPPEKRLFPITRQRAFQIIREAGEQAGIKKVGDKKIHNHHLRHSHCVAYIRKNNTLEGLRKLQQRIGHSNIQTTAHYLQFGPEQQRETEETFGNW